MEQVSLKIVRDNMPQLAKALKDLAKTSVEVGVPAAKASRKGKSGKEPINNAALLYIHDNGSPAMNIPARPVMAPGIADERQNITERMRQAGAAILDGRDALPALTGVGLIAQNSIRNRINSNTPPPLQASTIKARKRKGFNSERTLVVTAKMRNAVSFVVKRGNR